MSLRECIQSEFRVRFGTSPDFVVRAPGRINIIGEHTDYNDGFVLPAAINRTVWIGLRTRADQRVFLQSMSFKHPADFSVDHIEHGRDWDEYIRGVAWALKDLGYRLQGWEGILISSISVGAGLSSSAALEMAAATAFSIAGGWQFDPLAMARIGQLAENEWVGAKTGIMDQMASACGLAGHAILIDCRSLEYQPAPIPEDLCMIVMDTKTRRGLVDSAYNERRKQCELAAKHFGVEVLRDLALEKFAQEEDSLEPAVAKRARHVITENERVTQSVAAMNAGDKVRLGALINASHASLRDDFQVSSEELDVMVAIAQKHPGCYGARMTGAGFGGCGLALVAEQQRKEFVAAVKKSYLEETGVIAEIYPCKPVDGVSYQRIQKKRDDCKTIHTQTL